MKLRLKPYYAAYDRYIIQERRFFLFWFDLKEYGVGSRRKMMSIIDREHRMSIIKRSF